ncbi:MAG: hypothetical protein ACYDEY_12380, partial [Acidimicrobiales bacterium]
MPNRLGLFRWAQVRGSRRHTGAATLKSLVDEREPSTLRDPFPQPLQRTAGPRSAGRLARSGRIGGVVPHEMRDGAAVCDTRLRFSGEHS